MHKEEVELFYKRAQNFLKGAKERYNDKDWDLTCFMAEQAAQLYIKTYILEKGGEIPRTHSIRKLIALLSKMTNKEINIDKKSLKFLESAYLNTRYFNITYEEDDAKEAIEIVEGLIKFVGDLKT